MKKAVIKYHFVFLGEKFPQWGECGDPNKIKELSSKDAKARIREEGLVLVHEDENGKIYDTPDREWSKQWMGVYKKRNARLKWKFELAEFFKIVYGSDIKKKKAYLIKKFKTNKNEQITETNN